MFFNGMLLGVIGVACQQHGMSLDLWSFVAPHGSLELPSIILAGAAGLRLAYGLLFPGSTAATTPSPWPELKPLESSRGSSRCW